MRVYFWRFFLFWTFAITKYYWVRKPTRKNWVSETLWGFPNGSSEFKHWFLQGVRSDTLVQKWVSDSVLGVRETRKPSSYRPCSREIICLVASVCPSVYPGSPARTVGPMTLIFSMGVDLDLRSRVKVKGRGQIPCAQRLISGARLCQVQQPVCVSVHGERMWIITQMQSIGF